MHIKLDMKTFTLRSFEERIMKGSLNMVAPDAEIEGKGVVLISSDAEEREESLLDKVLAEVGLADGSVVSCDDFLQNYNLRVSDNV